MRRTYLDFAAAAPVSVQARKAFLRGLSLYGNPSSPHEDGRLAKEALEDARTRIARLVSVKPDAVIFTSGATEANSLALVGQIDALRAMGRAPEELHVLYLPSAHASTLGAMETLRERGVAVEALVLREGAIDLEQLKTQIRPQTCLVALDLVCGETGIRFAARDVHRVMDAMGSTARLHVDASQAPYEESCMLTRLGADTLTLDAQKVGGVRGSGVLIVPRQVEIAPLLRGGGQERGLRPGTESPALALAFASALEDIDVPMFVARAQRMREQLLSTLMHTIPSVVLNEGKDQVAHIVNLSLLGRDTDYLVALLSEAGFSVSTKSACATNEEGSRAVLALTGDPKRAASTLRISWGPETTERDLRRFADTIISSVRFMDTNGV